MIGWVYKCGNARSLPVLIGPLALYTRFDMLLEPTCPFPSVVRVSSTDLKFTNLPGGDGEEETPDPMPNSAVKLLCADDTSSQDAGK